MKKILFIFILHLTVYIHSFAQQGEEYYNPKYATVDFFEDFSSSLDPLIWQASFEEIKGLKYTPWIWVDDSSTIYVDTSNDRLCLSMISSPNYTVTDWEGKVLLADYIAGEIYTKNRYHYGVFECNARFAHDMASFPAFWLHSKIHCNTYLNEIDIVECKTKKNTYGNKYSTLQNNIFHYSCGQPSTSPGMKLTHEVNWDIDHTFKCSWSPYRISFFLDNILISEYKNQGEYWYPDIAQNIILSQQLDGGTPVVAPQTSYFNWVNLVLSLKHPRLTARNSFVLQKMLP